MGHIKCKAATASAVPAKRTRKPDAIKYVKRALAAGLEIKSIAVHPDGGFELKTAKPGDATSDETNPWDKVLRNDPTNKKRPA